MRLGILTGGGDVPGLNSCIKAAATRITEEGHEMFGLRRGWAEYFITIRRILLALRSYR